MSRIQDYWRQVNALAGSLPEFVWVVSTADGSAECVTEVSAALAARLLHAKTHRVAAPEEVDAHHAREKAAVKHARLENKRKAGAAVVVVDDAAEAGPATSAPAPRRRR